MNKDDQTKDEQSCNVSVPQPRLELVHNWVCKLYWHKKSYSFHHQRSSNQCSLDTNDDFPFIIPIIMWKFRGRDFVWAIVCNITTIAKTCSLTATPPMESLVPSAPVAQSVLAGANFASEKTHCPFFWMSLPRGMWIVTREYWFEERWWWNEKLFSCQ